MAKQKLKLPLDRSAPPGPDGRPGVAKAKRKIAAKAKRGALEPPEARKRFLKSKRKGQRGERPASPADGAGAFAPARPPVEVVRPRAPGKRRAPAALGPMEKLAAAIEEVRRGVRASPRTRKLIASGTPKMAQKVIEEAAELAIEAIRGDRALFVHETVDLFYNLLVLCSEMGVPLSALWLEMDRREVALGMSEKLPKVPDL